MIQFIIRDFQAIEEAKINVEGLTLLVGQSSSGKSACLRAISAAFNNRFRNGQVRHNTEQAVVKVKFSDSPQIFTAIRPWSGSIKMFLDKIPYSKIGRTLPLDISNLLNTSNIDVSGDVYSLNFHEQFQKPLLLEFSQKKVMDLLSASQGLDDLQETKGYLAEKRLENKGAFKSVDAILSNTKEQLSNVNSTLESVKPLEEDLDTAITAYKSFQKNLQDLEELSQSIGDKVKLSKKLFTLNTLITLVSPSAQIYNIQSVLEKLQSLYSDVVELPKVSTLKTYYINLIGQIEFYDNKDAELQEFYKFSEDFNQCEAVKSALDKYPDLNKFNAAIDELSSIDNLLKALQTLPELLYYKGAHLEQVSLVGSKVVKFKVLSDSQSAIKESERIITQIDSLELLLSNHAQQSSRLEQLNNIIENHICPVCGSKVQ